MQSPLPFFPEQASSFAGHVDALFSYILVTSIFFTVLVTLVIVFTAFRFRRRSASEIGAEIHGNTALEIGWTLIPLILALGMFAWGAVIYVHYRTAPKDTLDIYVVGKQWMWKLQQPNGRKEINELHIPVNRDIKLILGAKMSSTIFTSPPSASKWTSSPDAITPCGSGPPRSASTTSSARSIAAQITP